MLKDHETSTQDSQCDRLNKLRRAHKALWSREIYAEEETELDRLTGDSRTLGSAKPNPFSFSASSAYLEKKKALVEKVDLSPEELATAKQSLKYLVALLKGEVSSLFSE